MRASPEIVTVGGMASAPATSKIVPRDEVDTVVAGIPPFSMHRCVGIAFGPQEERRPRNVATVTVVKMFGTPFLVTAKHVVDSGPAKEFPWRLLVPTRDAAGRIPDRKSLPPRVIPIDSSSVIWRSELNDVAVLRAPPDLHTDSFDGDSRAVAVARRARETWDETEAQDAYQMVTATGFPLFGRNDAPDHIHYSLMSLPGFIVHAHKPEQGIAAPTFKLNLGCTTMHAQWEDEPLAAKFFEQLVEDEGGRALAGMSGGPVVIAAATGFYLVGILSEGSKMLETGIAVPWDVIHTDFGDSLVLGNATTRTSE
jgi:hypothetical protein